MCTITLDKFGEESRCVGISLGLAVRILLVEHIEELYYTTRSARKVWLAPISDKTEVKLRRFEIPLLGSDFHLRMQSHTRLGQRGQSGSVLDIAHMIFETGGPICRQLR